MLTLDDIRQIGRRTDVDNAETLVTSALSFGCQIWIAAGWKFSLVAPTAESGSPRYAAQLLQAMSDRLPKRVDMPNVENVATLFESLARLCCDVADEKAVDVIGRAALIAGISVGRFGQVSINGEEFRRASAALEKSEKARTKRAGTLERVRFEYEEKLLSFALDEIAADPRIANAAIQRRFRAKQKLPATMTSDNEAKILARFRREGRLPAKLSGRIT